jgi:serine/threonine protein phosphatase 1
MTGRTIAIGDVHGCSDALAALIDAVRPEPVDTVVTLGDLIDRGPDSRGVLDQLVALTRRCRLVPVLGIMRRCSLTLSATLQTWASG